MNVHLLMSAIKRSDREQNVGLILPNLVSFYLAHLSECPIRAIKPTSKISLEWL